MRKVRYKFDCLDCNKFIKDSMLSRVELEQSQYTVAIVANCDPVGKLDLLLESIRQCL